MSNRIIQCAKEAFPSAKKTAFWVIKITAVVSVVIFLLRVFNILPYISRSLAPVMGFIGLPGEASLAFVTGYFINIYSCIAAADTLNLSSRSVTILAVLVMCAHNMIVETAVQKKIGSSAIRILIVRTLSGILLAWGLNKILPPEALNHVEVALNENPPFWIMFKEWLIGLVKLCIKMFLLIYLLSVLQQILKEFGIMEKISKFLNWPLKIFGLPQKTSFLWIIANTLGLAYGAAVIFQEREQGELTDREVQLLNSHICISHSNLEDLLLFVSIGAVWWIVLLVRWFGSLVLVWEERLEFYILDHYILKRH